ncbi:HAD-IA family hydrolase [Kitasatospora sp. NPDC085879]|uniref:HAD family hydrolase n=1 Tax=Kitasatospora sp. NPDC085879 TaxID=3154769 RepID=UPI003448AE73
MTTTRSSLARVLRPVKHVLLDFDGPMCSVFAGLPAPEVAHRLRSQVLTNSEHLAVGTDAETDPLALLRLIAAAEPDLVGLADQVLAGLETEAVQAGQPNTGGEAVLRACALSGRMVSVVSNNAGAAIERYLSDHGLRSYVVGVFGRTPGEPSSMKPSPRLLLDAMEAVGSKPAECIFIGDAARDVEAGEAAGVATIGFANKPGKDAKLAAAGAVVIVDSMQLIADTLS